MKRKLGRGYTEVMTELNAIAKTDEHKVKIMADAIAWGYGSARTNHTLESRLYYLDDLTPLVSELASVWDGQDYIAGALYVANRYYNDTIW